MNEIIDFETLVQQHIKNPDNPISYINIDRLKKWDINPRTITVKAMEDLKYKIKTYPTFFIARPILVNYAGDDNNLVVFAGNQRLEASLQLGIKKVPVIIFNNLPEQTQKELAIIDNHNDGEWKMEALQLYFKDINFDKLGLNIIFEMPKFEVPTITAVPTVCGKTEEIPVDNSTKAEQVGYPISNDEAKLEEQEELKPIKTKHICPHCGCEFED